MGYYRSRFPFDQNATVGVSIERASDGLFFDFSTNTFVSLTGAVHPIQQMLSQPSPFLNQFIDNLPTIPTVGTVPASFQFPNGLYHSTYHNISQFNEVIGGEWKVIYNGDDQPYFPVFPTTFEISGSVTATPTPTGS